MKYQIFKIMLQQCYSCLGIDFFLKKCDELLIYGINFFVIKLNIYELIGEKRGLFYAFAPK